MKKIFILASALVIVSPAFIGVADLYCYFFFGSQVSSIDWNGWNVMFAVATVGLAPLIPIAAV